VETEPEGLRKLRPKNTKSHLHEKLLEMARRQGIRPIDDISILQAPEPIDDDQFEQEISNQRERHRMKERPAK